MPVHIKEFSVEASDQPDPGLAEAPNTASERTSEAISIPSGRQVTKIVKMLKQRACRLHAD